MLVDIAEQASQNVEAGSIQISEEDFSKMDKISKVVTGP